MDNTITFEKKISAIDNVQELESIISNLNGIKRSWINIVEEVIEREEYSQTELAKLCEVSKATVTKWLKGSFPQNRETYIKFGFAAKYNLQEMNNFLNRYGRYPELYAKSLEDCVYIFVLQSGKVERTYGTCKLIMDSLAELITEGISGKMPVDSVETNIIANDLANIKEVTAFKDFIIKQNNQFDYAYAKFYEYVQKLVRKNNEPYIDMNIGVTPDNRYFLGAILESSSYMKQYIHNIYHKKVFPKRREVIALGINLNTTFEEMNELLQYAHMNPLYAKNPTEATIIYALKNAQRQDLISVGDTDLHEYVIDILNDLALEDQDICISNM